MALTAFLLGMLPAAAEASVVCERLRDRLAATPQVIGNTAEIRSYSSAIARQNLEIRKTRQDMVRMRCSGSIITFDANGVNACGRLEEALNRMERNKQVLTDKRDSLRGEGAGGSSLRRRLQQALETNGCNEAIDAAMPPAPADGMSPDREALRVPPGTDTDGLALNDWRIRLNGRGGTLRTLCVRTCDGAFFPISSNATPVVFGRDASLCRQMCPGTQTELFYHSLLSEESADMVSAATGRPYRDLPNAFAYLHRDAPRDQACGCNLSAYHESAGASRARPEPYSGVTEIRTGPPAEVVIDPKERPYDPAGTRVRSVGPVFLPPETSSIDLKHPALTGPQPVQQ